MLELLLAGSDCWSSGMAKSSNYRLFKHLIFLSCGNWTRFSGIQESEANGWDQRLKFVAWQRSATVLLTSFSLHAIHGLLTSEQHSLPSRQRHNQEHEFGVNLPNLIGFLMKLWRVEETLSVFLEGHFTGGKTMMSCNNLLKPSVVIQF